MEINLFGIKIHLKKEYLAVGCLFIIIIAAVIGYRIYQGSGWTQLEIEKTTNRVEGEQEGNDAEDDKDEIYIHITGCVKNPGIVILERGSMIIDAINAAGGATDEADLENINLVYRLFYNQQIRILSREETKREKSGETGPGAVITTGSGGASDETQSHDGKININSATKEQLLTLPGIGERRAEDILIYRDKNGGFRTIEDIMNISGIGEVYFQRMKDFITVD